MEPLLSPVPVAVVEPPSFKGIPGHIFLLKCLTVSILLADAICCMRHLFNRAHRT
eukprot:CAMPEP_0171649236 /NCGR_PEP_ID=MMETSP0990-20121206/36651_1 /TAXON_ID=483369 /ORGANISM="non described non described, Strain CCMP2098" /LENGTH=54 /DNA_ID=CAMNT_0012227051 /DNA_START=838 /DNA_END=1002 /DNA_ORIENTATION=-